MDFASSSRSAASAIRSFFDRRAPTQWDLPDLRHVLTTSSAETGATGTLKQPRPALTAATDAS